MNKTTPSSWDLPTDALAEPVRRTAKTAAAPAVPNTPPSTPTPSEPLFDIDGLMTDFPTARELEQFVFDQTGHVLNLKGRSNRFKYQTAMDVLNGTVPEDYLLGKENPYLDKNDLIPVDVYRTDFPRVPEVDGVPMVSFFQSKQFPHPDPDWKAAGQKCDVVFKKYANNVVTYEIIGPVAARPVGVRINKFGKEVPEKYTWVDPRTGEQMIRNESGAFTQIGTRLRNQLQKAKINGKTFWEVWVDREFFFGNANESFDSPWDN